jgi:hypothetical protein
MTREDAIAELSVLHERLSNPKDCEDGCYSWEDGWYVEAIDMAIEALKEEPIRCGECKHQDECEEVVLFDVNDDEVIGHRLHWCSYGE